MNRYFSGVTTLDLALGVVCRRCLSALLLRSFGMNHGRCQRFPKRDTGGKEVFEEPDDPYHVGCLRSPIYLKLQVLGGCMM